MAELLRYSTLAFIVGFLLDRVLGDPQGWPHLIRFFGHVITFFEKILYPMKNKRMAGAVLVLLALLICGGLPALLLFGAWKISPLLFLVLESLLCWQLLAARSLQDESLPVYNALQENDLQKARSALSMIVGRDTKALDAAGITRATVETIAENTADGVAAPMIYMALGGAVLGCVYKTVNTMDSMVGYRNERYEEFGFFAAKLDDVFNYIPSRLCAMFMVMASAFCGLDSMSAFRIWRRDRRKHASPNSAQTEAVMAGALGIQLAGDAWYFGKRHHKPSIGDATRPIRKEDIRQAHRVLLMTSILLLIFSLLTRGVLYAAL